MNDEAISAQAAIRRTKAFSGVVPSRHPRESGDLLKYEVRIQKYEV